MYARVVTARLKLATIDRGLQILSNQVRSDISRHPGFQGWELLVDRQTGAIQAITHWSSAIEARGAARDGFRERTGMLDNLLEGVTTETLFEVVC